MDEATPLPLIDVSIVDVFVADLAVAACSTSGLGPILR